MLDRVEDVRLPVDEHARVVGRDPVEHPAPVPLDVDRVRVVDHVGEAEHGLRSEGACDLERRAELAADAERMPVDEDDLGLEGLGGRREQSLAQHAHLAARERQAPGCRAVVSLLEARQLEDADARRDAEALGLLLARDEEDRCARAELRQLARDTQAAADVPEAEPVVRVEQEASCLDVLGVRGQGKDRLS